MCRVEEMGEDGLRMYVMLVLPWDISNSFILLPWNWRASLNSSKLRLGLSFLQCLGIEMCGRAKETI